MDVMRVPVGASARFVYEGPGDKSITITVERVTVDSFRLNVAGDYRTFKVDGATYDKERGIYICSRK